MKAGESRHIKSSVIAVAMAATLGMTAACGSGGGGGGDEAKGKPVTEGKESAKSAPALTEAQVRDALIGKGGLKKYKFKKMTAEDMPAVPVPATPASCQPLADLFMIQSRPKPATKAGVGLSNLDEMDATIAGVALLAHEQSDAEKVVEGLRTAVGKCKDYKHAGLDYKGVKGLDDPKLGDESLSYGVTNHIEGTEMPMTYVVVRSGPTVAMFYASNLLKPKSVEVPTDIIEAQLSKLEKV